MVDFTTKTFEARELDHALVEMRMWEEMWSNRIVVVFAPSDRPVDAAGFATARFPSDAGPDVGRSRARVPLSLDPESTRAAIWRPIMLASAYAAFTVLLIAIAFAALRQPVAPLLLLFLFVAIVCASLSISWAIWSPQAIVSRPVLLATVAGVMGVLLKGAEIFTETPGGPAVQIWNTAGQVFATAALLLLAFRRAVHGALPARGDILLCLGILVSAWLLVAADQMLFAGGLVGGFLATTKRYSVFAVTFVLAAVALIIPVDLALASLSTDYADFTPGFGSGWTVLGGAVVLETIVLLRLRASREQAARGMRTREVAVVKAIAWLSIWAAAPIPFVAMWAAQKDATLSSDIVLAVAVCACAATVGIGACLRLTCELLSVPTWVGRLSCALPAIAGMVIVVGQPLLSSFLPTWALVPLGAMLITVVRPRWSESWLGQSAQIRSVGATAMAILWCAFAALSGVALLLLVFGIPELARAENGGLTLVDANVASAFRATQAARNVLLLAVGAIVLVLSSSAWSARRLFVIRALALSKIATRLVRGAAARLRKIAQGLSERAADRKQGIATPSFVRMIAALAIGLMATADIGGRLVRRALTRCRKIAQSLRERATDRELGKAAPGFVHMIAALAIGLIVTANIRNFDEQTPALYSGIGDTDPLFTFLGPTPVEVPAIIAVVSLCALIYIAAWLWRHGPKDWVGLLLLLTVIPALSGGFGPAFLIVFLVPLLFIGGPSTVLTQRRSSRVGELAVCGLVAVVCGSVIYVLLSDLDSGLNVWALVPVFVALAFAPMILVRSDHGASASLRIDSFVRGRRRLIGAILVSALLVLSLIELAPRIFYIYFPSWKAVARTVAALAAPEAIMFISCALLWFVTTILSWLHLGILVRTVGFGHASGLEALGKEVDNAYAEADDSVGPSMP